MSFNQPKTLSGIETGFSRVWRLVVPTLIHYEITNVLHRYSVAGELSETQTNDYLQDFFELNITTYQDQPLHHRAALIAKQYSLPAAYDAHYLALAERLNADFWTADKRLARSPVSVLPWVNLLSESSL